jgi:dTDP-4-dehydrorhamnose reductase
MDVTNEDEVRHVFDQVKPDIIVHAAAETNVDRCEIHRNAALAVNSEGTRIVAKACERDNGRMVYVSTDYVFDGKKGRYTEDDKPNPVNYYGLTKLMGEKHVTRLCKRFAILRTSVLYGVHAERPNFAMWVVRNLKQGKPLTIVEDHFNSPTLANNFAGSILEIANKGLEGIYHIAGSDRASRYEFAMKIAEMFDLDANLVRPIKMGELKAWIAKRPKDSSLSTDKVRKEIDTELVGITRGLAEMKREWVREK